MLKKVEDNTNLKRAEEALRESDVRYRQLFQSAPIALIEWDVSHLKAHLEALRAGGVTDFIVFGKSLVVSGYEDTMERVIIALEDISRRKKAERALKESEQRFRDLSFRDGLTGLYNQRFLFQSLAADIEHAETTNTPISLIFMDLDHFKEVVDTHGHLNGNLAIQKVACTINDCLKPPAYAVAYAGDEFIVVLPEWEQSQALKKAYEIRSRLANTPYVLSEGIVVHLQAIYGVATFPHDAQDLNGLVAAANQALFAIKKSGNGGVGRFQDLSSFQPGREKKKIPPNILPHLAMHPFSL